MLYLINGNYVKASSMSFLRRARDTDIILCLHKADLKTGSKTGWIIRSKSLNIGSYANNWNSDFTVKVEFNSLSEEEQNLATSLLKQNYGYVDRMVIYEILGLEIEKLNINIKNSVIDIEGFAMFNSNDISRVIYSNNELNIYFYKGNQINVPRTEEVLNALRTKFDGIRKISDDKMYIK